MKLHISARGDTLIAISEKNEEKYQTEIKYGANLGPETMKRALILRHANHWGIKAKDIEVISDVV